MTKVPEGRPTFSGAPEAGSRREIFPKEFDLLCAAAGVRLTPERVARITSVDPSTLDWKALLLLAEHQGVLPLLARSLTTHVRQLPPDVGQQLRAAYEANLRRSLWFANELVRITDRFAEKNLLAVPYKGPVLAESAYGDVALRNFSDLDFLISPSDFDRGKQILADLAYHPSNDLAPAVERFWLRKGYERSFDSAAGKYLVELQWRLLPFFYAVEIDTGGLLARSQRMTMAGREIPCLAPEDSLLVLCLHAAKHLWIRLIWVCDIAETLGTQPLDWSVVTARARDLGILRILGVSFWLARTLLDTSLPVSAEEIIAADPNVPALGEVFAARIAQSAAYDLESPEYFRWILRLRERRSDRWLYLQRLIVTPGQSDLAALRLPERLFPLYRLVRLGRLIRKLT